MNTDEKIAFRYLQSQGFNSIDFEPNGNSTPPDFVIEGNIAIEVRRMNKLNKIDYIRDIGLFTNLLELQNIKSVIVDMQTIEKKKELMLKIKNKTLIHKVKLFR